MAKRVAAGVIVLATMLAVVIVAPIAAKEPAPPKNDLCENATPVSVKSVTPGTTDNATVDSGFPSCDGVDVTAGGVWYTVVGNGRMMRASTCRALSEGWAKYNSQISVYCGGCDGHACIGASDDASKCEDESYVEWCSRKGETYHILVHGYGEAVGKFELDVLDGTPCDDPIPCMPGVGGVTVARDRQGSWIGPVVLVLMAASAAGGLAVLGRRRAQRS